MKRAAYTTDDGLPKTYLVETIKNPDGTKVVRKYLYKAKEDEFFKTYKKSRDIFAQLDFSPYGLTFDLLFAAEYATGENGGVFYLTPRMRESLCANNNISLGRLKNILTKMVQVKFLLRLGRNTYQINPLVCARGKWKDVVLAAEAFEERKLPPSDEPQL